MSETKDTKARMLQEMITTFIPAKEEERQNNDVILLTTEELMERMAPMMPVDKGELSRALFDAGFRLYTRVQHGNGCSCIGNQKRKLYICTNVRRNVYE